MGGGGHCKSVANAAESAGFRILGILDLPQYLGDKVLDYSVIGNDDDMSKFVADCKFIITLGFIDNASHRIRLHQRVEAAGGQLATVIADDASVHRSAKLEAGTVVLHRATINADARIGRSCIINTAANIEHDVVVGEFSHISTGVMVNGNCHIGQRVFVGSGSVIANGIRVCDDVILGCGSVVVKDITAPGTYVGNPARKIK